jgi:PilZ domain
MRRFKAGERQRAQRFPIQTALRYRRVGEGEWRQGTMINISESGVLFETDHSAWPNTALEIRFNLCLGVSGEVAAHVVCQGLIARVVSEPGGARATALAVRITKFDFVRPGQAPLAEMI